MAKQTKKAAQEAAAIVEAEVIETAATVETVNAESVEVVRTEIVPVKRTAETPVLFNSDNKAQLIQAFITSETVRFTWTPEKCAELLKKHKNKKVKDETDLKGYEAVKAAYSEFVKARTLTDAERKDFGSPYDAIKKGIDGYVKTQTIGTMAAEEARLKAEKEKFEKWEEARLKKEAEEAEKRAKERVQELKDAGLAYDGEMYVIGDLSVDIVTIKKMKDADYTFLLEKVKDIKAKQDKAAAEAKAAKEAEEAATRALQEENERKARELREEKLELRREKLEDAGFVEQADKERFYMAGDGYLFELSYDDVAAQSASDFKNYLHSVATQIETVKATQKVVADAEAMQKPTTRQSSGFPIPRNTTDGAINGGEVMDIKPADFNAQEADFNSLEVFVNMVLNLDEPKLHTEKAQQLLKAFQSKVKHAAEILFNDITVLKDGE